MMTSIQCSRPRPAQDEILPAVKVAELQIPTDPLTRWTTVIPVVEELKRKARKLGLWNLFLSKAQYPEFGVPLTNLEVCLHFCSLKCSVLTRSPNSMPSWPKYWVAQVKWAQRLSTALHPIPEIWASSYSRHEISGLCVSDSIPEVLARYGNREQQKKWLLPLLNGEIRSAFSMTERFGLHFSRGEVAWALDLCI
jgi:acyl-CoA dehydrogenase